TPSFHRNVGGPISGNLFPLAQPLSDFSVLQAIRDVAFGAYLNPTMNAVLTPRRLNDAAAFAAGIDPGVPFPPGGQAESCVGCNPGPPPVAGPVPPHGVRLYVTDDTGQVKVFDSQTFLPLGSITGVPGAYGLSINHSVRTRLWVTNFDQSTIMRLNIDPTTPTTFHQILETVSVGMNPTAISVNPDNEVVCVLNSGENSFSSVEVSGAYEREKFPVGLGANEIITTSRHIADLNQCPTGSLAWSAFIPNRIDSTVTVFESESTSAQVQNGVNGRIVANLGGYSGPKGGCWNYVAFPNPGFYVANSTGSGASLTYMVSFQLQPPPGFPGIPAIRNYQVVQTLQAAGLSDAPHDVALDAWLLLDALATGTTTPAGATVINPGPPGPSGIQSNMMSGCYVPMRLATQLLLMVHPGDGVVSAVDANSGVFYGTASVAGNKIYQFFDQ
ncbi:MAG: hypothetical protein KDB53_07420, partial [Planctomycetes bacterium]|nr:hypothetical protein [Planctomycetota bacterium]